MHGTLWALRAYLYNCNFAGGKLHRSLFVCCRQHHLNKHLANHFMLVPVRKRIRIRFALIAPTHWRQYTFLLRLQSDGFLELRYT